MSRNFIERPERTRYGIYAHVPFCTRRCDYCDFYVTLDASTQESFFGTLKRDLELAASRLPEPAVQVDSLYFGGGTPSLVEPRWIERTVKDVLSLFNAVKTMETSLEANPETVTPANAEAWRGAGVNRLSLGVQSFDDEVLRPRGRCYTGQDAMDAFRTARHAGFDNIGIDLIAGLPGESLSVFLRGVDTVIELQPEHVSIYILETAESLKDTPLARAVSSGRQDLPCEEDLILMYTGARDRLVHSGYCHYEISNFARPGYESRHNLKYWRSEPLMGIGPSAHSFLAEHRTCWPPDRAAWEKLVESNAPQADLTCGTRVAQVREALILALRLTEGVDLVTFGKRWEWCPRSLVERLIQEPAYADLLSLEGDRLRLTRRGVLLSNEVFARLT